MSVAVRVLLALLALAGCGGHGAAVPQTSTLLKESITLLGELLDAQVSCDKMNATNIFIGNKSDDMEILCKASAVAWEGRSCHNHLEGIYMNLLSLLRIKSAALKAPCAVATGNTMSLNDFLLNLRRVLQRLVKD
ncbi:interleukin-4-like [Patagioenas fasciata]|uniref:interleukin-4-like n=1 Tax=Patagioenas fasciata TaxID=372321 RepID=UPI003A996E7B